MPHYFLNIRSFILRGNLRAFYSILIPVFLGMAATPAPVFAGGIHALSDVANIRVASDIECPTTGISPAKSPAVSAPANEAIGRLDKALRKVVKPKALSVLLESPEVRDPGTASRLAAVALADHMPEAALALLLQANKIAPKDPMTWVNVAAMSNYLGDYQDAFAATAAAEKLPGADNANVRGSLLVNKGNALLGLGRPQEAQVALGAALKLAPDLPEAYTTMAYALGDQGKCSQGVRFLRAGAYRHPPQSLVEATKSAAEIDPDKPSPTELISHLPVKEAIDLSKGLTSSLPRVVYATDYKEVKDVWQEWAHRTQDYKKRWAEAAAEEKRSGQAAAKTYAMWTHSGSLSNELTAKRAEFLMGMLSAETGTHTAEYHEFAEAEKKMEAAIDKINGETNETFVALAATKTGKKKFCALQTSAIGREGAALRQFELQASQYYGEIFHRATAIAANFSEPAFHQYANASIDFWRYGLYMRLRPVGLGTWYTEDMCDAAEREVPTVNDIEDVKRSVICQAGNKTKVTAKAGVVSAGVSCEKVEVKVATPGPLGVFAQAEYEEYNPVKKLTDPKERFVERTHGGDPDKAPNLRQWSAAFDGKLTIYGGVEGSIAAGGITHTANGGASVTIDGLGNVSDVTGKSEMATSVGVSIGAGSVSVGVETQTGSGPIPTFTTSPSGLGVFSN